MSTYTITVTDNGDVAAVANGGTASIVVSDGTSSEGGAVTSVNGHVGVVVLDAADVGADASGAAATAQTAAEAYTDTQVATEVARADAAYDDAGAAAAAQATAEAYTDTQLAAEVTRADAAYDAAGAASAAQAAAEGYTDTAVAGRVASVVAGTGVTVDATDPENPVVSATATGGGSVDSVSAGNSTITVGGTATDPTIEATVGTTAGTVAAGDDSRITGAAQKSANLGDLASASSARTNLGLGTSAVLDVPASGDAGTGQVVKGTDSRLTDARTPTSHTHAESDVTGLTADLAAKLAAASNLSDVASASTARTNLGLGTAAVKDIPASGNASSTQVVYGSDTRLSDSRTPSAHASTHASAGSDPITIAESQVTNLTTDLAAKAPLASPTFTGDPKAPTPTAGDNDTSIATTAFVATSFAPLASPALTGNPTVPTQAAGTNSTRAASTAYADNAVAKQAEVLMFALGDETTAITTGTKVTFRIPFAFTITEIRASLTTASSSGNPAVDVKKNGTTVFSTALTIDATEKTSKTAATAAVLSTTALSDDDEIALSVTTAGTGAAGLKVTIIGTRA